MESNGNSSSTRTGLISHLDAGTIPGLFRMRVAQTPEAVAYCDYDDERDVWRELTWTQISGRVGHFRALLAQVGLDRGDRVGMLLRNSPDWVAFDIAAMASGFVTVPLYLHDSAASTVHILSIPAAVCSWWTVLIAGRCLRRMPRHCPNSRQSC